MKIFQCYYFYLKLCKKITNETTILLSILPNNKTVSVFMLIFENAKYEDEKITLVNGNNNTIYSEVICLF